MNVVFAVWIFLVIILAETLKRAIEVNLKIQNPSIIKTETVNLSFHLNKPYVCEYCRHLLTTL